MAESVVFFALQRVHDLLISEAKFLHGVSGQVVEIQTELKRMQCFLRDADARQDEDEMVHNWVAEIREVAYDAEDVIETFVLKVLSRRKGGALRRYTGILSEGIALHYVGSEIGTIKSRISNLTASLQTYGLRAIREGESSNSSYEKRKRLRRAYSHVVEEDFVGLEEEINQLVENLLYEDDDSHVVSIFGMGGLGKTTLARKVYHHSDTR